MDRTIPRIGTSKYTFEDLTGDPTVKRLLGRIWEVEDPEANIWAQQE